MKISYFPPQTTPDDRFSKLVGQKAWDALPKAVRKRFGKHMQGGASVTYQGVVVGMQMSFAGRILAHAARIVGAPLPYDLSSINQPAVVTVTEDIAGDGQFWIRQYGREAGFPQVVHSSKRFSGPTGLEEYIGFGLGMALTVSAESESLLFKSEHYFLRILGHRIRIPRLFSPGGLVIGHHDMGAGQFRFSLNLTHPFLGQLISQNVIFQDTME